MWLKSEVGKVDVERSLKGGARGELKATGNLSPLLAGLKLTFHQFSVAGGEARLDPF